GRSHIGTYFRNSNAYYGCGEAGHKVIGCTHAQNKGKDGHPQGQGANASQKGRGGQQGGAPRKNRLYAL
ncbi:MAG: hypothetical protein Q8834_02875, partial [Candidatus Phytoplasma australasiaticum]|nr:hypothetical protein [Candidatus Phytoplasma australasiaticum]